VAHDFNNMLQIISGNLQLLQLEFAGNEVAAARLQSAVAAVGRGAKLSSQLLAFARRQPLQPVVVNINRMIIAIHDLLRQALPESIEIGINATGQARAVLIDPHQLENVIINLALNASHAMQGKGQPTIVVSDIVVAGATPSLHSHLAEGEYVTVSVIDTGADMTEEVLEHAFEPFFTTKPEGEGTGLGLSMAYGFVKQSGDDIHIDSEVGKDTAITIYMPRVAISEMPAAPKEEMPVSATGGVVQVVEDDLEVQTTTVGIIKALGYEVLKADNVQQALEILEKDDSIDLLFTDVIMPGAMSGPELAEKASEIRPALAVLFTSGYTRDAIGVQNILKPDINLLHKPYHYQQLATKLRQLLGARMKKKAA
jgi:CheY-like chemotaxis protein